MNRDLGLDDARDRQMHDTFDPEPEQLDPDAHSPADRPPAEPRKRDWTNVGSPIIRARLDPEQRAYLLARATTDGVTPSDVIRSALDAYLDRRPA